MHLSNVMLFINYLMSFSLKMQKMKSQAYVFLYICVIQLNLTELRTFPNPPAIVTNVSAAVLVLLSPQGRIPKDRSWKASKTVMSKVKHCMMFIKPKHIRGHQVAVTKFWASFILSVSSWASLSQIKNSTCRNQSRICAKLCCYSDPQKPLLSRLMTSCRLWWTLTKSTSLRPLWGV